MIIGETIIFIGLAYLLGSIPFSFLVARSYGIDLRKVGSGNIGAANVGRACGRNAFLLATFLDMLKGAFFTAIALYNWGLPALSVVLIGSSAILGHTFPLFLGFRGGKAVSTSGGVLLAIFPLAMLIGVLVWLGAFAVTRISSVGSLAATLSVLLTALISLALGKLDLIYTLFICVVAALVFFLHRSNIHRLLKGTENRFQKLN